MKPLYLYIFAIIYSAFYYAFANTFTISTSVLIILGILSVVGFIGSVALITSVLKNGIAKRHLVLPIYYLVRLPLSMAIAMNGYPHGFTDVEPIAIEVILYEMDFAVQYLIILLEPIWATAMLIWSWKRHEP